MFHVLDDFEVGIEPHLLRLLEQKTRIDQVAQKMLCIVRHGLFELRSLKISGERSFRRLFLRIVQFRLQNDVAVNPGDDLVNRFLSLPSVLAINTCKENDDQGPGLSYELLF